MYSEDIADFGSVTALLSGQIACLMTETGKKPWCYTTNPKKRWEFCDIPMCKTGVASEE